MPHASGSGSVAAVTDTWALFDRLATEYDATIPFFGQFGEQLMDLLNPPRGSRVLDIGCGRGAIAIAAAKRGCDVTATDASPRMVELLVAEHPEIDAYVMDAHHLDLPDASFDLVTGGFMIHIVDDAKRVMEEAHRVLRPDGTVAFTTPGESDDGGRWAAYDAVVKEFRPRSIGRGRPGRDDVDVEALLPEAGFVDVRERLLDAHLPVRDAEEYWRFTMSHGFAGFVESLSPDDAAEFKRLAFVELERMREAGGIVVDRGAWVDMATKA